MKAESQIFSGFLISAGIHALVLTAGGALFVKPAQYAVDSGLRGVEIQLRKMSHVKEMAVSVKAESEKVDAVLTKSISESILQPQIEEKSVGKNADEEELSSNGGAITELKPDFLSNPAPVYPLESRRRKQQGLVLISVDLDRKGNIKHIYIKQSTGYKLLDDAAIQAVRRWKFAAARIGHMTVESRIDVPIRFRLEKDEDVRSMH